MHLNVTFLYGATSVQFSSSIVSEFRKIIYDEKIYNCVYGNSCFDAIVFAECL